MNTLKVSFANFETEKNKIEQELNINLKKLMDKYDGITVLPPVIKQGEIKLGFAYDLVEMQSEKPILPPELSPCKKCGESSDISYRPLAYKNDFSIEVLCLSCKASFTKSVPSEDDINSKTFKEFWNISNK